MGLTLSLVVSSKNYAVQSSSYVEMEEIAIAWWLACST